jgi:hypothetical protein
MTAQSQSKVVDSITDEAGGAAVAEDSHGQMIFRDSSGEISFEGLRSVVVAWRLRQSKTDQPWSTTLDRRVVGGRTVLLESDGLGGCQVRTGTGTPWGLRLLGGVLERFEQSIHDAKR